MAVRASVDTSFLNPNPGFGCGIETWCRLDITSAAMKSCWAQPGTETTPVGRLRPTPNRRTTMYTAVFELKDSSRWPAAASCCGGS